MSVRNIVYWGSGACIIASIGEFVVLFGLGELAPQYNQLTNTMSSLGAPDSPVSLAISTWWCIAGFLFILFGISVKQAYVKNGSYATIAAWLIIVYGAGDGIGSGLFKADHHSYVGLIHNAIGGIGVTAILILPLVMQKIIPTKCFSRISMTTFILGIAFIALFLFRFIPDSASLIATYKGLWQRLFMLNTYTYLTIIAYLTIIKYNNKPF